MGFLVKLLIIDDLMPTALQIVWLQISISVFNNDMILVKSHINKQVKFFLLDNQEKFVSPWHHIWNSSFLLVLLVVICQYLQRLLQEHTGHKQCEPIYKERKYDFAIKPFHKMLTRKINTKYVPSQITSERILWSDFRISYNWRIWSKHDCSKYFSSSLAKAKS